MNIEAQNFKMEITYGELWSVAFDLKRNLENSLKTHWVNHQQNWKKHEEANLRVIKTMFYALGRPEIYEQIDAFADNVFKEFNSNKK
ncbi:MAG: hypothetical protein ACK5QX_11825 [bacterium]|jgi:hypothetical protein